MQDGIINVFKPKGCTSHDIVYKIKKITDKKVGHTGTLDPLAQGVLPILIGKGTLCSKYLINHNKIYKVQLELGKRTATLDAEGEILEEREVPQEALNKENIKKVLNTFKGQQQQKPPIYSAVKIGGKKLYEYARRNETIDIKPRNITIYNIQLLDIDVKNNYINFEVFCSKGTYIRVLCEEIAKALNTIGYMKELLRIQVGEFKLDNAISLQSINKNKQNLEEDYKKIDEKMITIEQLFSSYEKIKLSQIRLKHFLNGVRITVEVSDGIYRIYQDNKFIGIGIVERNLLKRDIIL